MIRRMSKLIKIDKELMMNKNRCLSIRSKVYLILFTELITKRNTMPRADTWNTVIYFKPVFSLSLNFCPHKIMSCQRINEMLKN